ncbi:unnamed protein product, partial [Effrenium voratum]
MPSCPGETAAPSPERWQVAVSSLQAASSAGLQLEIRGCNKVLSNWSAIAWNGGLDGLRGLRVRSLQCSSVSFNSCLRGGWHSAGLVMHMAALAVEADVITCNTVVTACFSERWQLALATAQTFQGKHVEADTVTANALLAVAWAYASDLLKGLQLNVVSRNTAIHACGTSGRE